MLKTYKLKTLWDFFVCKYSQCVHEEALKPLSEEKKSVGSLAVLQKKKKKKKKGVKEFKNAAAFCVETFKKDAGSQNYNSQVL